MTDLAREREQLALANRHVAEEEARVAAQKLVVARFSSVGQDTSLAADMLRILEDGLLKARRHREIILQTMLGLTAKAPKPS
ncbi:hypothetical protein [Methylobacterium nigriterrae]|uniref:hypothetical protein n=1 Tax=Methylobacterium nigriterrae TaxID=3127512 RepID=UPI003013CC11